MSHYHTDQVHDEPSDHLLSVSNHSFINLSIVALYRSPCLPVPISNSEFIVVFLIHELLYTMTTFPHPWSESAEWG